MTDDIKISIRTFEVQNGNSPCLNFLQISQRFHSIEQLEELVLKNKAYPSLPGGAMRPDSTGALGKAESK